MIKILPESTDKILAIKASGTLTHKDYEEFVPMLDATVQKNNYVYLLADITEFSGMTPHAMVDDFLAGMKYWWNFEAVAVIGNKSWEKYLSQLGNYVTPADVRYFEASESPKAWRWLEDEYSEDHPAS